MSVGLYKYYSRKQNPIFEEKPYYTIQFLVQLWLTNILAHFLAGLSSIVIFKRKKLANDDII